MSEKKFLPIGQWMAQAASEAVTKKSKTEASTTTASTTASTTPSTSGDWGAEYGITPEFVERVCKSSNGFSILLRPTRTEVYVDIFRSTDKCPRDSYTGRLVAEDGFDPVDLMFSGKLEITRNDQGAFWSCRPLVNPIHMHHGNSFGPQRGYVIANMIKELCEVLEKVEESVLKNRK